MRHPVFWCRNEGDGTSQPCPNRLAVNSNAKPLVLKDEYDSAWKLQCPVCRGYEIHSKSLVGGTIGQGRRDNLTGTTTGKGGSRYRAGMQFTS